MSKVVGLPTHWAGLTMSASGYPVIPACGERSGVVTVFPSDVTCVACLDLLGKARDAMQAKSRAADSPTGDQLAPPESFVGPTIDVPSVESLAIESQREDAIHGKPLTAQQLQRLGAIMPEGVAPSRARADHLVCQREQYAAYSKVDLIDELIRRDESEILRGQDVASGRMMSRLIREFLRGVLYSVDAAELKQINAGDKTTVVEKLLQAMGTEPADARQLRLEGSMVGNVRDGRSAEESIESPVVPQLPSPEVADAIQEKRREMVPQTVERGTNDNAD